MADARNDRMRVRYWPLLPPDPQGSSMSALGQKRKCS
jgi:hypothetical protein